MKLVVRFLLLVVVLVLALLGAGYYYLDSLVKSGIEAAGPVITKVSVKVDGVKLSPLSGNGSISGLQLGNPVGFSSPLSVRIGKTDIAVVPASVLSDTVVVRHIRVIEPEITLEVGAGGVNLKRIEQNVMGSAGSSASGAPAASGGGSAAPAKGRPSTKLRVDEVLISGARLNASTSLLGGASSSVTLPDIRLSALQDITPAELTARVLQRVLEEAAKSGAGGSLGGLLKGGSLKIDGGGLKDGVKGLGKMFGK